jgi:hypothetical protein
MYVDVCLYESPQREGDIQIQLKCNTDKDSRKTVQCGAPCDMMHILSVTYVRTKI